VVFAFNAEFKKAVQSIIVSEGQHENQSRSPANASKPTGKHCNRRIVAMAL